MIIDLKAGRPEPKLLPQQYLLEHLPSLHNNCSLTLGYGEERGETNFINTLASFLSRKENYNFDVNPNHLFITNGNSQALHLLCHLLLIGTASPDAIPTRKAIFVQSPTYFLAFRIFDDFPCQVVPIASTNEGTIDLELLETKLKETKCVFLYIIPSYHNPTGASLSDQQRQRLVKLSQTYDFKIVSDDVYQLLGGYSTQGKSLLPPLSSYDSTGLNVISMGSFSKILAPGLRLGWIQSGSPDLISKLSNVGFILSGGGCNPFVSDVVNSYILSGNMSSYLEFLKQTYSRRSQLLVSNLKNYLTPGLVSFSVPDGGYFLWLQLLGHWKASDLLKLAETQFGVSFALGSAFGLRGSEETFSNCLRLCFAYQDDDSIIQGAKQLALAINHFASHQKSS